MKAAVSSAKSGTRTTQEKGKEECAKPLFDLGEIFFTPGVLESSKTSELEPWVYLRRHVTGDWSEMDAADQEENWRSIHKRLRIFSAYRLQTGCKVWIITEADRRMTTLLKPEEY